METLEISNVTEEKLNDLASFFYKNHDKLPSMILLEGEIGVGKTTFSRMYLESFSSKLPFSSPTYSMVNEYDDVKDIEMIYHFDLYRASVSDYEWIFEKMDTQNSLFIIEWASLHPEVIELDYIKIDFKYKDIDTRDVFITSSNNSIDIIRKEFV